MWPAFILAAAVAAGFAQDPAAEEPPIIEPLGEVLDLEQEAAYAVGIQVRGTPLRWLAWGWSGVDELTLAGLQLQRRHQGADAVFVHPPYRSGPGRLAQQFRVRLPQTPQATLRGATATDEQASRGDGVTFRVWADAQLLWEKHHASAAWEPFKADLAPWGGRTVTLRWQNLFVGALVDWTASSASRLNATGAVYEALTDGTRSTLHERVLFSAAWHLAEVLPNLPHPVSPYRQELGSRIVFDIWGGRYQD